MNSLNGIKIVSFDVDGTLVKENFNDLIWQKEIPSLYARKRGTSLEKAEKMIIEEYKRVGENDLRWYSMDFWISHFHLDVQVDEIISKYESRIEVYPEVPSVLEKLKEKYSLIIITMMPSEFLVPKLRKIGNYFKSTFSTISDFKDLKSPQGYLKICQKLQISPVQLLHIGDQWKADYLSPKKAEINTVFLDRKNEKRIEGECIIRSLDELQKIL
ncbi:MAG: HAD family hydrolase [Candidatus Aerophobetes bacterium]|nr:HAD family hydrolase [Candidatus Aerophobetes bacterium]